MTEAENKQATPWSWRPYKPIREALAVFEPENLNYMINSALGEKLGIPQAVIDAYRREKK